MPALSYYVGEMDECECLDLLKQYLVQTGGKQQQQQRYKTYTTQNRVKSIREESGDQRGLRLIVAHSVSCKIGRWCRGNHWTVERNSEESGNRGGEPFGGIEDQSLSEVVLAYDINGLWLYQLSSTSRKFLSLLTAYKQHEYPSVLTSFH
jgi:hypothetical protein